ncbi:cytochrome P450 [Xylariaceae sp. FL1272]|nr:cytochrome P450 [Xylariaceae sp. FL1272]
MPSVSNILQPQSFNFTTTIDHVSLQGQHLHHAIYYTTATLLFFCAWFLQSAKYKTYNLIPYYGASRIKWMFSADVLIRDSYRKFQDTVYEVKSTEGLRTIIPPTLVGELKGLPEDVVSAKTAVSEAMLSDYTQLSADAHSDTLTLLLKTKATQNLARMVPHLKEELEYIISNEFPQNQDWTPFKVQPFMVRAVSRLSGRAFVGSRLCRCEEWMDVSINFAITAFIAVTKLQFFPPWMRPAAQYLVPELKTIRKDLVKAQDMLQPLIEERLDNADKNDRGVPDDFIQWLSDALPEDQKRDYYIQSKMQLLLSASSIHTTSNLTTDCIYDLAVHQDMQEILRQEVIRVFGEDEIGWEERDSISRLKKMDSFIKESQRLSGNISKSYSTRFHSLVESGSGIPHSNKSPASFIRKVMKPITLSNGTHLAPGTNLLTPLAGVAVDERFFPSPETFDGLRFYKLRQLQSPSLSPSLSPSPSPSPSTSTSTLSTSIPTSSPSDSLPNASKYQFTSIGDTSMNFGLGKHACPGRFFASQEIKLILSYLLLKYEIRLPEGASRPKPTTFMMTRAPCQTAEVLVRRRTA